MNSVKEWFKKYWGLALFLGVFMGLVGVSTFIGGCNADDFVQVHRPPNPITGQTAVTMTLTEAKIDYEAQFQGQQIWLKAYKDQIAKGQDQADLIRGMGALALQSVTENPVVQATLAASGLTGFVGFLGGWLGMDKPGAKKKEDEAYEEGHTDATKAIATVAPKLLS